jgi:hypothetical protein
MISRNAFEPLRAGGNLAGRGYRELRRFKVPDRSASAAISARRDRGGCVRGARHRAFTNKSFNRLRKNPLPEPVSI